MSQNSIQFQIGLSLADFLKHYGSEESCREKVIQYRWPDGYRCGKCGGGEAYRFQRGSQSVFECKACLHQCSLTAGTLFERTHLPLTLWFQAFYLICQSKNSMSALELHRHLGINYKSAWLLKHKIMEAMHDSDREQRLEGRVEVDDAYLGGKLEGGSAGRGSENKSPFIAAVQTNENKQPLFARFTPVAGFTKDEVTKWARDNVSPNSCIVTDGLACFNVFDVLCDCHEVHVVSREGRKETEADFRWVNTVLSNVKTSLSGTFHSLNFYKYGYRYLADLQFRFNRRFDLKHLFSSLVRTSVRHRPCPREFLESALSG